MTKAVIYCRVSSEDQAKQYSLPAQKKTLRTLAHSRGYGVVQVYDEGGISGESLAARPQILQLLDDAEAGEFQYLLIVSLDRLSRNLKDAIYLREKLQESGVTIVTPSQEFAHDSIDHDLTANIWGTIADYERKRILERCQQGRIEKRSKGGWLGGTPPRGYIYNPVTKALEVDDKESENVLIILKMAIDHSPYFACRQLKKYGISITPRQIRRTIEPNKLLFYTGQVKDYEGNIVKAEWPAIISQGLADKISKAKRKRRVVDPGSTRAKYLLTGLGIFKCRFCGSTVKTFRSGKYKSKIRTTYYRCSSIQKGIDCVNNKMRPVEKIEDPVWHQVELVLNNIEDIEKAYQERLNESQKSDQVTRLKKVIDKLVKRRGNLVQAIETGTITLDEASTRLDAIRKEEIELQVQIADLSQDQEGTPLRELKEFTENRKTDNILTWEEKRHLITLICHRIELGKGSIYIKFRPPIFKKESSDVRIQLT